MNLNYAAGEPLILTALLLAPLAVLHAADQPFRRAGVTVNSSVTENPTILEALT